MGNLLIAGFRNTLYGRPGRDEEIQKVQQSIRAAGAAGVPVVEYNFYAHRLTEGYYAETGRAGTGLTAFDYDRVKDLPPLPNEGAHTLGEMWNNIAYFLKAVVPVAEQSGVRMALHPNDPPAPISRGSEQIMGNLEGWKHLIVIVPSKSNGITFDCGVTRELGEDPVEVCRYFGSRDRINHVHFRNVRVEKPREKYMEVFVDEGQVDMFAVMKELVREKYPRLVYPEHPRGLDADSEVPDFKSGYPGGGTYIGYAYNVGYTRAMLQAALEALNTFLRTAVGARTCCVAQPLLAVSRGLSLPQGNEPPTQRTRPRDTGIPSPRDTAIPGFLQTRSRVVVLYTRHRQEWRCYPEIDPQQEA